MDIEIRDETPSDPAAIAALTTLAFATAAHSSGTEAAIVDALREAGMLTLSLVAVSDGERVGHVAFSPITVGAATAGWYGLGPVSVRPERQGEGIGSALIRTGLERLRQRGAAGCILVGDGNYYRRFGFENDPAIHYEGVPPEYLLALRFGEECPSGEVRFHAAFGV